MQLEIEQKFRLSDTAALRQRLGELGVVLAAPIRQVDTYFQHPARDFRLTDEAFRLRQIGELNFVTYKGPKIDTVTKTRRELELPLPPGPALADHYRELFAALGFRVGGVVRKQRRHGHAAFAGRTIDIAWDEVDDLGAFLELEIVADEAELPAARAAVMALAERLGLEDAERRSYLELLLAQGSV